MIERAIIAAGVLLIAGFLGAMFVKTERNSDRCATIGAEYLWGRDFSACVKPDGSLWRVP